MTAASLRNVDTLSALKSVVFQPLQRCYRQLASMAVALVILAAAQAIFLLMVKGFMEALFSLAPSSDQLLTLSALLPEKIPLPEAIANLTISRVQLSVVVPMAILVAGLLKSCATYVYQLDQHYLALFVAKSFRERLFAGVMHQRYGAIAERPIGEWMSAIMNDVLFLQMRFSEILTGLVKDVVVVFACLIVLTIIHWPTAVALAGLAPIVAFAMGRTGRRIAYYSEWFQKELGRLAAALLDIRRRFDFIRAQGGEALELDRFMHLNRRYYQSIRRSILTRSAFAPALEFFGFCVFAFLVSMIGQDRWGQDFSPTVMMQFFVAVGLLLKPLRNIGEQLSRLHEVRGSLRQNLFLIRDRGSDGALAAVRVPCRDTSAKKSKLTQNRSFCVERVSLSYGTGFCLECDRLNFERGSTIALVGKSGSGKSTLVKCLAGLIPPDKWAGEIDYRTFANQTAMVSQKPFLFEDSILENLRYGTAHVTEDDVWDVLERVHMRSEIKNLEEGLHAQVRAISSNFSGGQIQRLVIARAMLRARSIWLLDEATSAIDSETESDIYRRLIQTCHDQGKVLLAVTHRTQHLPMFDSIWFMEAGRVVLRGCHQDLESDRRYRQFLAVETK